ncbi:DUF7553 family protein [Natrinema caseinilyticum]|uniref:DUF7553 family protein n=1 Tax=Natrinema caseinilyticum TaxID=2961570 RepID=UPI0020C2A0CB|nr:hypothetical protein [Natrinema caseinilyticum]
MTQGLQQASSDLEDAAETADGDLRDTLRETAREFEEIARDETVADHAVLDTHLNALRQARERAGGDTEAKLESAIEAAEDYRESLDQA